MHSHAPFAYRCPFCLLAAEVAEHVTSRASDIVYQDETVLAFICSRQHNEPAGNQEVWHYHLHLYPRYANDGLYRTEKGEVMAPAERAEYARLLRGALASPPLSLVENVVGRAERQ